MSASFWLGGVDLADFLQLLRDEGHEGLADDLEQQVKRLSFLDGMVGPSNWLRSTTVDGKPLAHKWRLFINRRRQARHRARHAAEYAQVRIRRDLRDRLMKMRRADETLSDLLERLASQAVPRTRKGA